MSEVPARGYHPRGCCIVRGWGGIVGIVYFAFSFFRFSLLFPLHSFSSSCCSSAWFHTTSLIARRPLSSVMRLCYTQKISWTLSTFRELSGISLSVCISMYICTYRLSKPEHESEPTTYYVHHLPPFRPTKIHSRDATTTPTALIHPTVQT